MPSTGGISNLRISTHSPHSGTTCLVKKYALHQLSKEGIPSCGFLGFVEMPDYNLIDECLRGFLRDKVDTDDKVPSIDWKDRPASSKRKIPIRNTKPALDAGGVGWILLDKDADPLDDNTLVDSEIDRRVALEVAAALEDNTSRSIVDVSAPALDLGASLTGEAANLARLPLQLQFRLAQVEYNARHPSTIQSHIALRDWMALAIPLAQYLGYCHVGTG